MGNYRQIINPHAHSDYSSDGGATVKQIVQRNAELGATHVSLTEHGNLNSAVELYLACKKTNLKPILGTELYLIPPYLDKIAEEYKTVLGEQGASEAQIQQKINGYYTHLVVHFKDEWAYKYFCQLTPAMEQRAIVRWGETKPLCTFEELAGAAGHITVGTACVSGPVAKLLLPDRNTGKVYPEMAYECYKQLRETFGPENFFVEIFPHVLDHNWDAPKKDKDTGRYIGEGKFTPIDPVPGVHDGDIQKRTNQVQLAFANRHNDRVLISIDSHFALPEQKQIQDSRLTVGAGIQRQKYYVSYHIPSTMETIEVLKSTLGVDDTTIQKWVDNSYEWASMFDEFKLTTASDRWILHPLEQDWKTQLKDKIDKYGRMDWSSEEMKERLKYELSILCNNGVINLIPYFFVIEDIANFCKDNSVLINVRGSAGGVLLLYLLGVSATNPLKHGLSFERFLTLGRIKAQTLPDVDIDVADQEAVFNYLQDKYGDGFCRMSTDSTLKIKSAIKDAERSLLGKVSKSTERISKNLPTTPQGVSSRDWIFGYEDDEGNHVQGIYETNKDLQGWISMNPKTWNLASSMLDIVRQKSVHACSCVLSDRPIQEFCPIITVRDSKVTGFSPKSAEEIGLIKYDILRVNTLKDIQGCLESIKNRTGEVIDPWHLPYDEEVMRAFGEGKTETVFQFNTQTVIPYLKKVQPKDIDDLAMVTAICRPGTLEARHIDGRTLSEVFVARKAGESIQYIHEDLEPILKETVGIAIYQETTLRIFRDLAGYSYEQAEIVRRGIGKKDEALLRGCMEDLRKGCEKRGWNSKQIDLLINQIMASSRYSFNKSHAVSYAYVAYACMYLKEKYKIDWWLSCLRNAKKEELPTFWNHIKDIMLLPDVNKSSDDYTIEDGKIRMPISTISGVGPKTYESLVSNKPYEDLEHFVQVHFGARSPVNTGTVHKLIVAGVLDSLYLDRGQSADLKIAEFKKLVGEVKNCDPDPVPEEFIGITSQGNYLAKKELIKIYSTDLRPLFLPQRGGIQGKFWKYNNIPVLTLAEINKLREANQSGLVTNGYYSCLAYVVDETIIVYQEKTKQATKLFLDDNGSYFEEVIWPNSYKGETAALSGYKGYPVLVTYSCGEYRFRLHKVTPIITKDQKGKYNIA